MVKIHHSTKGIFVSVCKYENSAEDRARETISFENTKTHGFGNGSIKRW